MNTTPFYHSHKHQQVVSYCTGTVPNMNRKGTGTKTAIKQIQICQGSLATATSSLLPIDLFSPPPLQQCVLYLPIPHSPSPNNITTSGFSRQSQPPPPSALSHACTPRNRTTIQLHHHSTVLGVAPRMRCALHGTPTHARNNTNPPPQPTHPILTSGLLHTLTSRLLQTLTSWIPLPCMTPMRLNHHTIKPTQDFPSLCSHHISPSLS
jgi:hypothetical protein